MIPKNKMEEGWYKGFCRNNYVAYWDSKKQLFYYLRYSFGHYMDTIEHFEDVAEKKLDGFVPLEKIERTDYQEINKIKVEIGY